MEEFKFVLKGVHPGGNSEPKTAPKFITSKVKPKGGKLKVQSFNTQDGYTVKIANTECVEFSKETGEVIKISNCWYDKQPFDEDPICLPYEYKVNTDYKGKKMHKFRGPGSFCSIFCLWAYICDEMHKQYYSRDPRIEKAAQNTKIAFSVMFNSDVILRPAPDWRLLDCFGGPLSITEFRKASYDKTYVKLPNVLFEFSHESYVF